MRLPECSKENPEGAKFCIQCATPSAAIQKCGFEIHLKPDSARNARPL